MKTRKLAFQIWTIAAMSWAMGGGAAGFLFFRLAHIVRSYEGLLSNETQQQDASRQMQVTFKKQVQEWKDILIRGQDPEEFRKYVDGFHKDEARVQDLADSLVREVADLEAREVLMEFERSHKVLSGSYAAGLEKFVQARGRNLHEVDQMVKGQDRRPTDLVDLAVEKLGKRVRTQRAAITNNLGIFGVGTSVGLAGVIAISTWLIRRLNHSIRETVLDIRNGTEQVADAAAEVSSMSQGLAEVVSEEASSVEQTSTSTEEIASIADKNADKIAKAAEQIAAVDGGVGKVTATLSLMAASMREINASSEKMSKIVDVIDQIAFQTNILALNAAVEAARAGEAGMGFAVVADEVRNLARRSGGAAKDTATLIEESIQRLVDGNAKLNRVAEAITAITSSAASAKTLIEEVRLGGQEQRRRAQKIATMVTQMELGAQKSAASAEESAAAGEELTAQAASLRQSVERLQALVGNQSPGVPHARAL